MRLNEMIVYVCESEKVRSWESNVIVHTETDNLSDIVMFVWQFVLLWRFHVFIFQIYIVSFEYEKTHCLCG